MSPIFICPKPGQGIIPRPGFRRRDVYVVVYLILEADHLVLCNTNGIRAGDKVVTFVIYFNVLYTHSKYLYLISRYA